MDSDKLLMVCCFLLGIIGFLIIVGGDIVDSTGKHTVLICFIIFIIFIGITISVVLFGIKDDESIKKVNEKLQVCEERLNQECPKCVDCESCFFESIEPNVYFHHIEGKRGVEIDVEKCTCQRVIYMERRE